MRSKEPCQSIIKGGAFQWGGIKSQKERFNKIINGNSKKLSACETVRQRFADGRMMKRGEKSRQREGIY